MTKHVAETFDIFHEKRNTHSNQLSWIQTLLLMSPFETEKIAAQNNPKLTIHFFKFKQKIIK